MLLFVAACWNELLAQPANDNWSAAQPITVTGAGFGLGTFSSAASVLDYATMETGEYAANPIFQKSVWYTFTIATTRQVSISMVLSGQDVSATSLGFFVYRETTTLPLSTDMGFFTDGAVGATSTNECLTAGKYYIQLCGSFPLSINLNPQVVIDPTPSANLHDAMQTPDNYGVVTNGFPITLEWPCLSLQTANEYYSGFGANYRDYSKSYWITFQTDNHIDLLSYYISQFTGANGSEEVAVRIFDAPVTPASLNPINAIYTSSGPFNTGVWTHIPCLLLPNTTYYMQIVGRRDYSNSSQVYLAHLGEGPTAEPIPTEASWNAGNDFGTVTSTPMPGTSISRSDYFSCESQMSEIPGACNNLMPANGFTGINNATYDLSNWFTLNLTQESSLIVTSSTTCQACPGNTYNHSMYLRVLTQTPNNNCNSFQLPADVFYEGPFNGSGLCYVTCLPPGEYTLQIMGRSQLTGNPYDCANSQFGRRHDITVAFVEPAIFEYGMAAAGDVDAINNGSVLQENIVYSADLAELTCEITILPDTLVCWPSTDRAVYRTLEIGDADNDAVADSGMLIVRNYNYQNYPLDINSNSVFYSGDVDALAQAQSSFNWPDVVSGLDPQMGCNLFNDRYCPGGLYNMQRYCVTPGTYTLAQFGDSSDVGAVLQPTFEFRKDVTQFWNPAVPDNMGDLLATGLTHISQPDTFSCIDNPQEIDGIAPCGRTKLIYREFYLSQEAEITISEISNAHDSPGDRVDILFFSGQVSQVGTAGLSIVMDPIEYCQGGFERVECRSLPPGWYTVVSYGRGPNYDNNFEFTQANGYTRTLGCGPSAEGLYSINYGSQITIQLDTTSSPGPFYYRPGLSCVAPSTISYVNLQSADYPSPFTEYVLCDEYFKDSVYQSLVNGEIFVCADDPILNKVAYYTFTTDDEYFLRIRNLGAYRTLLYELDVTTNDSLLLQTEVPVVPCEVGSNDIEICSLGPGTYSLLVFADTAQKCVHAQPIIDVSPINYSRFDFASHAYDFDEIPSDGVFHAGRIGDVHPTNPNLSPSNDFFYCTTGASPSDPVLGCNGVHSDSIYNASNNPIYYTAPQLSESELLRRNLWYTFVVRGNGTASVDVRNLSNDAYGYTFHVYSTDLSGEVSWSQVLSANPILVDSTITSGLALVTHNVYWWCDGRAGTINFNVQGDPCDSLTKRRFYIVVDRFHPRDYNPEHFEALNGQIDVRLLWSRTPVADYPGDECVDAVAAQSMAVGIYPACTIIDCHTMVDPFWDLPQNVDCLQGPVARSSTWYKFTYDGPDVVDVGFQPDISGLSNYGLPADIDYRIFYGKSCPTMLAGAECAQSSYISNSIACVDSTTGDFYVEVTYPDGASGTLCFNFSVTLNTNPNCIPFNPTAVDAFFIFDQVCTLDTVNFTNYSTVGLQMAYEWDFGHDNASSSDYSTYHVFPQGGDYLVTLTATNTLAGSSAVYSEIVHVLDSTDLMNLVGDTTICYGDTITLGRDLYQATYSWSTGATSASIDVFLEGVYAVDYTVLGCPFSDETVMHVFQLIPPVPDSVAICANTSLVENYDPLDSLVWVISYDEAVSIDETTTEYFPDGVDTLQWIAYDQGCFVAGETELVELYAYVPTVPSWDSSFCTNYAGVQLPIFLPNTTGTFEYENAPITGLDGNDFSAGDYWMSYIYADSIGCPDTLQVSFHVLDSAFVQWTLPHIDRCVDGDTIVLADMMEDTSGVFYISYTSGAYPSTPSDVFVPQMAAGNSVLSNNYDVRYEVSLNGECVSQFLAEISLQPDPVIDLNFPLLCDGEYLTVENLTTVDAAQVVTHVWDVEGFIDQHGEIPQSIPLSSPGYLDIEYIATSSFGCMAYYNDSVLVQPSPQVQITYSSYCQNEYVNFSANAAVESSSIVSYQWYIPNTPSVNQDNTAALFSQPGMFDVGVHVWSAEGCESDDSLHVTIFPQPALTLSAPSACLGQSVVVHSESSLSPNEVASTIWYVDNAVTANNIDSLLLHLDNMGSIAVEVEQYSDVGCSGTAHLEITALPLPTLELTPIELDYCIGDSVTIGCIPLVLLPQTIASTQWDFSNGYSFNNPNATFLAQSVGAMIGSVLVTTDQGCSASFIVDNYIVVHPNPIAGFHISNENLTYYADELKITNQSSASVNHWEYEISDGFSTMLPTFMHKFNESGYYSIQLAVSDSYGCADTIEKSLEFAPDVVVHIPNAFSPDADGLNDVFLPSIYGDDLTFYRLLVFDRWGTVIFESLDPKKAWLGDVRGDGYYAMPDAYNYIMEILTVRGYEKKYMGAILLLR